MPKDLMTLPHPDTVSALREINLDLLGFTQRCTQDYQGQGIVPLQLGDELETSESNTGGHHESK